jgi:hypothetical protein
MNIFNLDCYKNDKIEPFKLKKSLKKILNYISKNLIVINIKISPYSKSRPISTIRI